MKTPESLEKLLASFGPSVLNTGRHVLEARRQQHQRPLFLTHVEAFDQLNGGGWQRGTVVEITGAGSSGKFSLALAALSAATRAGESAAWVDLGDHFDAHIASDAGVVLERLFWVRPRTRTHALQSAEIVLTAGFRFVVLDFGVGSAPFFPGQEAVWMRLAHEAKTHDSFVLALTPSPTGSLSMQSVIETRHHGSEWIDPGGPWALLNGLSVRLAVLKHRASPERRENRLSLAVLESA